MRTLKSCRALQTFYHSIPVIISWFTWILIWIRLTFIRANVSTRTWDTTSLISVILVSAFFTKSSNTLLTRISSFAYFTGCSITFTICARLTNDSFFWSRAVKASGTYVACSRTNASIFTELTRCWLNCPFLFALESSRALLTHWLICNVIVLSSLALCHCWPTRTIVAYITRFFFAWYTTKARQAPITTALTNLTVLVIWTLIP